MCYTSALMTSLHLTVFIAHIIDFFLTSIDLFVISILNKRE